MKLTALQYGTTRITGNIVFPGGDKTQEIPIALLFFLIEEGDRRILVDTGCDTMPGFPLYTHEKPVQTLARLGLRPEDITDVILTHAHGDHAGCAAYYTGARFWIQQEALESAQKYLPPEPRVETFDASANPTESLRIVHVGGHALGSCIVELVNGLVLCGDECYSRENFTKGIRTGACRCPEKSAAFVASYRNRNTILFHDPELVGAIGTKKLSQI